MKKQVASIGEAVQRFHFYFAWIYKKPKFRRSFILLHALFTWIFFKITLPFGVNVTNISNPIIYTLLLGVYGILWIIFFWPLDIWIKPWNDRQDIGTWILKLWLFSTFFFMVWILSCWPYCITWPEYFEKILATFIMFLFSYLTVGLIGKNRYLQAALGIEQEEEVELKAAGEKTSIITSIHRLVYFQADDNYVDIHFIKDEQLRKVSMRTSLKSMARQLSDYDAFFQPHRSYLINLTHFKAFDKKSQQIVLKFNDQLIRIPLSAGKKQAFLELIGDRSASVSKRIL